LGRNRYAIIEGIASGIGSAAGALWKAAKSVLGGFKDKVLGFFGIHSPSRWMRDMVGINLTDGIGVGIDKGERSLIKTATSMSNSLANAIKAPTVDIAGNVARSSGSIKTAVSHTINDNLNNGSQPAEINLNIAGRNFAAFVEDISSEQGKITDLELSF